MTTPLVIFIIPSIGRKTLSHTLCSLYEQIDQDWYAAVCFDNVKPTIGNKPKIKVIETPKKLGEGVNGAGNVRNYAIKQSTSMYSENITPYFAFVDDDDILTPYYVMDFKKDYIKYDKPDIVIFRMFYQDTTILPPMDFPSKVLTTKDINNLEGKVGISFVCNSKVFNKMEFSPSSGEDHQFLKSASKLNYKIVLSDNVNYWVAPLGCAPDRLPK